MLVGSNTNTLWQKQGEKHVKEWPIEKQTAWQQD